MRIQHNISQPFEKVCRINRGERSIRPVHLWPVQTKGATRDICLRASARRPAGRALPDCAIRKRRKKSGRYRGMGHDRGPGEMPRQSRAIIRSENPARAGIFGVLAKLIRSRWEQAQARAPMSGPGPKGVFSDLERKVVPLKGLEPPTPSLRKPEEQKPRPSDRMTVHMATFRTLPSGNINVQLRTKGKPTISKTFVTMKEAKTWANSAVNEEPKTDAIVLSPITLGKVGRMYCDRQLAGKRSRHLMLLRYERMSKHFPQPFLSISRTDVQTYKLKRLDEVAGSTVREEVQSIHKLFNWAEREMIFGDRTIVSPARNVALPPPSKPNERVVTREEFDRLVSELGGTLGQIAELAWETAMRRSEITALELRHLNLDARVLTVENGKTGDRLVPLTVRAIEILKSASGHLRLPDSRVFQMAPHSVSTGLRRARERAKLGNHVRMHQLRHTRITELARRGLNPTQIMVVSGHRDIGSLQRYTHLNVKDVLSLID